MAERVAAQASKGHRIVLVVSAMGDTTDDLIALMNKVNRFPDRRELDSIMATGEMVSAALAASALKNLGVRARSFNAFNLHMLSEQQGDDYNIVEIGRRNQLAKFLEPGSVAVVAGFQGITHGGDLTTLGRGGSDLTAVVLARELGQKLCEKFTDEDGIYTADPRIVPEAVKIWHLNYDEMQILANFGNGILHPRAISCACESDIRIHVRSSFTSSEGSVIGPDGDNQLPLKSIACHNRLVYAKLQGIARPDDEFLRKITKLNPAVIQWRPYNQNYGSFRIGFKRQDAFEFMPFCWEQASRLNGEEVNCHADLATLSIVGCGLHQNHKIAEEFIGLFNSEEALIHQHRGIRLSFAVEKHQLKQSLEMLHSKLQKSFLSSVCF